MNTKDPINFKMNEKIQRSILFLIILILGASIYTLFAFIRSQNKIFIIWRSPKVPESYYTKGIYNREIRFILLPKNKVLITYSDYQKNQIDYVLIKMVGTFGHHYIGPFWGLDQGSFFGFRFYNKKISPIETEMEILNKIHLGPGESSFPEIGYKNYKVILKDENRINFSGMWLDKVKNENKFIYHALKLLKENKLKNQDSRKKEKQEEVLEKSVW